jgi:hypothetical protein
LLVAVVAVAGKATKAPVQVVVVLALAVEEQEHQVTSLQVERLWHLLFLVTLEAMVETPTEVQAVVVEVQQPQVPMVVAQMATVALVVQDTMFQHLLAVQHSAKRVAAVAAV